MRIHRLLLAVPLAAAELGTAYAQPSLVNARLETLPVSGSLDKVFRDTAARQTEPAWIGYSFATVP
ncbi:MAG: hypothetical protein ACRD7E_14580, partial [Bryobacteraceae bacterium]